MNTGRFDTPYPVFKPPIPLDSSPYPRPSVRKLPDSHLLIEKLHHFSRKVMAAVPLEDPNAGWINNALESAIEKYGAPKHIISDQANVFTGAVFAEILDTYKIKLRLGAVGKHGSISVTERVTKTLKYEWLKRVALIKGFDHLAMLCQEFETWYNSWRPHMTLDGIRPDDVYDDKKPEKPKRGAKTVPWKGGFNSQVQLMLTGVMTNSNEREKQLGAPGDEIAPQ